MEKETKVSILLKEYDSNFQLILYRYNLQAKILYCALVAISGIFLIIVKEPNFLAGWGKQLLIYTPPITILFLIYQLHHGLLNHLSRESMRSIEKVINKLAGENLLKFYTEYEPIVWGTRFKLLGIGNFFHIVMYLPFVVFYIYCVYEVGKYYSLLRIVYIILPIIVIVILYFCRRMIFERCAGILERI